MQKVLPSEKIVIIVDTREMYSPVVENLSKFDCEIREKQLEIGDYICSDRVCIERKTSEDFVNSIIDKRLFKQLHALSQYEKPLLVIEGSYFFSRNLYINAVYGAIASAVCDYGISVFHTSNPKETATLIFNLAKREQIDEKREVILRKKPKLNSISKIQQEIVAGLPYVNTKLSKRLLKIFKTPKRVFSASEKELTGVQGIGEKKARMIWKILNEEWKEDS